MKKGNLKLMCALLASCVLFTSCIGSFRTFNKLNTWNQGISGSKFVNELVFICFHIIPVYEVAYLADALIFNSIEFWGGSNPVSKAGEVKHMKGSNGDMFAITTTKSGYKIVDETRNCECKLVFDKKNKTWNAEVDGTKYELMTVNEDGSLTLNIGGVHVTTTADAAGVELAQETANGTSMQYTD
jgi:hypothetical protein